MRAHKLAQTIQEVCRNYIKEISAELIEDEQAVDDGEEDQESTTQS